MNRGDGRGDGKISFTCISLNLAEYLHIWKPLIKDRFRNNAVQLDINGVGPGGATTSDERTNRRYTIFELILRNRLSPVCLSGISSDDYLQHHFIPSSSILPFLQPAINRGRRNKMM